MKKEKISVICPMYNVEKYIEKCIQSIQNNTYKNLEIILVDDGSTDNTLRIAKEYEKKDKRIKIFSQVNSGAPKARNFGLEKSEGKYIMFFDADDELCSNAIEKLYTAIQGKELSIGNFIIIDEDSNIISERDVVSKIEGDSKIGKYLTSPFPNNKMFLSDIIRKNKIFWDDVKIAQDLNFYLKYLGFTDEIGLVDDFISKYRIHETGISRTYSLKILEIEKSIHFSEQFLKKFNTFPNDNFEDIFKSIRTYHYFFQLIKLNNYDKQNQKIIKSFFKEKIKEFNLFKNQYRKEVKKYRIGIKIYLYFPSFLSNFFINLYSNIR